MSLIIYLPFQELFNHVIAEMFRQFGSCEFTDLTNKAQSSAIVDFKMAEAS